MSVICVAQTAIMIPVDYSTFDTLNAGFAPGNERNFVHTSIITTLAFNSEYMGEKYIQFAFEIS